ncbi:MAG: CopD family protein [Chloroflexales bacterium]
MNTKIVYLWAVIMALSVLLGAEDAWAHPQIISVEPQPNTWQTTSALDVTTPAPEVPPVAAILLRGVMLIGAATGTGGLAFLIWLLGPALAQAGGDLAILRRWQVWLAIPLLVCATVAPLMFVEQTYVTFGMVNLTGLIRMATTRSGQVLLVRSGLALALVIAAVPLRRNQYLRHTVCLTLSAWLLLNFSLGGHASSDPSPMLSILSNAIHLGAASLWAGGLIAFAVMLPGTLRSVPEACRPELLRTLFTQFSILAVVSVTVLAITGTYATLHHMSVLSDLWTTGYGQALLIKLIAFGAMLLFGAYYLLVARRQVDAWATKPAEQTRQLPHLLSRILHLEAILGLIAILAAGALASMVPPNDTRPDERIRTGVHDVDSSRPDTRPDYPLHP